MLLDKPTHVHLIGIGGIGVSGVARALLQRGHTVSGSDVRESQLTTALRGEGARVDIGHHVDNLEGAELVVHSTAIPETNPELVAARAAGLRVLHRSEVLGALLDGFPRAVGVIGTHGKGTVSSAITAILEAAGEAPSFIIGGLLENFGKINARVTASDIVVAEVDESDGSLTNVRPTVAVINNLEADHLNYYDSLEHVQDTVVAALNGNPRLALVVVNVEDAGARALIPRLTAKIVTFGRRPEADCAASEARAGIDFGEFDLTWHGERLGRVRLPLPGLYNIDNAVAASAAALALGVGYEAIVRGLADFQGLENRFTVVRAGGRQIVKDYISHPTGIRRVLEAARQGEGTITAVFKPYRFTMINYLQEDYAEAFHDADHTIITELYTAGEVPIPGIDTAFLCDKIRSRGPKVTYIQEMDDIVPALHDLVGVGDQVLFFGGDDLFRLADRYAEELRAREVGP